MIKFSHGRDKHYCQVLRQLKIALGKGVRTESERERKRTKRERIEGQRRLELLMSLRLPDIDQWNTTNLGKQLLPCTWLLESRKYRTWSDRTEMKTASENCFLWIQGSPGSGKSTIIGSLTTHRRSRPYEIVLEFFFDSRGSDFHKSSAGLYRSLLLGIFEHLAVIHCEVDILHRWTPDSSAKWQPDDFKELLRHFCPQLDPEMFTVPVNCDR